MRVVLDTNVFVSAVFFHGKPFEVLRAWREGLVTLVVSPEILEEYRRVGEELARRYEGVDLAPLLALVEQHAEVVQPSPLAAPVAIRTTTSSWPAPPAGVLTSSSAETVTCSSCAASVALTSSRPPTC